MNANARKWESELDHLRCAAKFYDAGHAMNKKKQTGRKSTKHPFGTIEGLDLEFKYPNMPHYHEQVDPIDFTPFPKNRI